MKSKGNASKASTFDARNLLKLDWETVNSVQGSLRKILTHASTLPMSQEYIDVMKKFTLQLIKATERLRAQEKEYLNIQQQSQQMQSKLANHNNIIRDLEASHMERLKAVTEETKSSRQYYEKAKRSIQEAEETTRLQMQQIKKENQELKYKVQILMRQKEELNKSLASKDQKIQLLEVELDQLRNIHSSFQEHPPRQPQEGEQSQSVLECILCSCLGHRITQYLTPPDILSLEVVSRQCNLFMIKSKSCRTALAKSVMQMKNKTIRYFHRHINHFEKIYHKIPEEILQVAFYRYEIKKENIGGDILSILNSSAMLFEGKFTTDNEEEERPLDYHQQQLASNNHQIVVIGGMTLDIEKQMEGLSEFNAEDSNILKIDEDIVREFLEERKTQRDKISQEINLMYKKIQDTAQLYSADVESIGLFLKSVLKNFSKVFVMSKNLYAEARNLQSLNTFILRELSGWEKIQVDKNSQIEDLKAELEAERKLKIYFTDKSLKSEQRALSEENVKLGIEVKFQKKSEQLDQACRDKQELTARLQELEKDLKKMKGDNREIRKAYQNGKEKYNKIIEELSVVKETILRMNLI